VDAAADPAARKAALLRLCAAFRALGKIPGGDDAPRLFRLLLACVEGDDEELRKSTTDATDALFGGGAGHSEGQTYEGPTGTLSEDSSHLGLLTPEAATLRRALADIEGGRLRFLDEPREWAVREKALGKRARARTDVPHADPLGFDAEANPLRLSGAWTKDGLRLHIANEGGSSVSVDPVALCYGRAERTVVTSTPTGGVPKSETRFRIDLGHFWGNASVPRANLVLVAPKSAIDVDIPVREEFRGEPHVDVQFDPYELDVAGPALAPVIRFQWTPVF
jgi:hypothetical protein